MSKAIGKISNMSILNFILRLIYKSVKLNKVSPITPADINPAGKKRLTTEKEAIMKKVFCLLKNRIEVFTLKIS